MKLDELIRALQPARNQLVQMEELGDDQLESLQKEFQTIRDGANSKLVLIEESRKKRTR
jgi:low affinity Fe/Cu permease